MVEKISSIMSKSFKSSPEAGTGRVCKKNALKNFAIFTVPVLLSLFNKKTPTQKRLQHKCFPVNISKFVRTPITKNICEWLLQALV